MTTATTEQARANALDLESELARYPDERGEILLEAAGEWERAGDYSRARSLLAGLLATGGDDADWARYQLASLSFKEGADADAWAHLRELEQRGAAAAGPAELVAELLEERGEYEAALRWFDRALGPDSAQLVADVRERELPSLRDVTLFGRQRCRARLGLPADDLDRAADLAEQHRRNFADLLHRRLRAPSDEIWRETLVWQRVELEQAARRWPAVIAPAGYHGTVEHNIRQHVAEYNLAGVTLLLGTADGLGAYVDRTGADVAEESTRAAYAAQVRASGATMAWPPGRNQTCWCGSTRKYKKCCGGPAVG